MFNCMKFALAGFIGIACYHRTTHNLNLIENRMIRNKIHI